MLKVYIAGPISKGPWDRNIGTAIDMSNELLDRGFAVYLPHLNFFQALSRPREYDFWLKHDFAWIKTCDVLFRLPGESKGADMECAEALRHDIPVVHCLGELEQYRNLIIE
jgi:hypothetical protein